MALKAGYYGIKKAFKDAIESLIANTADMLVIKSLDDALTLSNEGELSVDDASTSTKGIVQLDDEPTEDSENAITSGAIFIALQNVGSGENYEFDAYNKIGDIEDIGEIDTLLLQFFSEGSAASGWTSSGQAWSYDFVTNNPFDSLLDYSIIGEDSSGNLSQISAAVTYNATAKTFSMNFQTAYNTYLVLKVIKKVI